VTIPANPLTYLDDSYSNIVVYDDTQWVSYMDDDNKAVRAALFQAYNMGGIADWAIELQAYADGDDATGTVVYVPPSLWTGDSPDITCEPPCIFVLPPYSLATTETVTWPALTTTLLSLSVGSVTVTITTTISVPSFVLSTVGFQPITLSGSDTSTYQVQPVQSITPPSFLWTLGPYEATFSPTIIPTPGVVNVGVGGPGGGGVGQQSSTSSLSSGAIIPIIGSIAWKTTSSPITVQPQPTFFVTLPPLSKPIPPVTIAVGPPPSGENSPGCYGCGSRDCGIFGCKPGCGLFGCDGGCGIFGCGGGCGVLGCIPDCPLDTCGGLGCVIPGGCGDTIGPPGPGGEPSSDDDQNEDCDEPATVSACTIIISSFTTAPDKYSTTTKTHCATFVECSTEDSVSQP
jgi:hypothetical protein